MERNIYKIGKELFITSDEKIKKGDWCMSLCDDESYEEIYQCKDVSLVDEEDKKIILTTDQELIKDGVQGIDDDFLEWFVKNPSCEEVEVEKGYAFGTFYKIIIPKEEPKQLNPEDFGLPQFGTKEFNDLASQFFGGKPKQKTQGYICPQTKVQCNDEFCVSAEKCNLLPSTDVFSEPKQETLEEASKNPINYTKETNGYPKIQAFKDGAKWKQERMYSDEDVKIMYRSLWVGNSFDFDTSYEMESNFEHDFNLWFEQFKKK